MSTVYVAYRTDDPENHPKTIASGSMTILKQQMREEGESTWTVATYAIKPAVPMLCQMIMDFSQVEAEKADYYEVTRGGRVRQLANDEEE